jgi:hypothetical protein
VIVTSVGRNKDLTLVRLEFGETALNARKTPPNRDAPRTDGSPLVPIAVGELIDKITILEIKAERIGDPAKLQNILSELRMLAGMRDEHIAPGEEIERITRELKKVNESLWEIEDEIRDCERRRDFGQRFIELARAVYQKNDLRSQLKRKINEVSGSRIVEEKSYAPY